MDGKRRDIPVDDLYLPIPDWGHWDDLLTEPPDWQPDPNTGPTWTFPHSWTPPSHTRDH